MQKLLQGTTAYKLLQNEAEQNKLSHTYLLLFNDEKNLRYALKQCAKLFFPPQAADRIERDIYPDCLFFPDEGKTLDKDATAAILEECNLSATEGGRKVFVLDSFHKASAVVQNKLLKSLEEPPKGVYFLLGATSEFPVLTTVLSRAKRLEIPPFSAKEVGACLERIYPERDKSELAAVAIAAGGSVGRAQNLLDGGKYAELVKKALDCVTAKGGGIITASRALQNVAEKTEILSLLSRMYRDMLLYATGQPYALLGGQERELKAAAKGFTPKSLVYALDVISEAEKQITFNANLASCIEVSLLKIDEENKKCRKLSE
ncbi:MAG: hypothetical protein J6Z36_03830 [Clostridia bacterium]|nr:hypothetical protein [Clostridia bacterium]